MIQCFCWWLMTDSVNVFCLEKPSCLQLCHAADFFFIPQKVKHNSDTWMCGRDFTVSMCGLFFKAISGINIFPPLCPKISKTCFACWGQQELTLLAGAELFSTWSGLLWQPWGGIHAESDTVPGCRFMGEFLMGGISLVGFDEEESGLNFPFIKRFMSSLEILRYFKRLQSRHISRACPLGAIFHCFRTLGLR